MCILVRVSRDSMHGSICAVSTLVLVAQESGGFSIGAHQEGGGKKSRGEVQSIITFQLCVKANKMICSGFIYKSILGININTREYT